MKPALADLAARRVVWALLADFYLDTDPALFRESAARDLAATAYPLDELRAILHDEVHPAVCANVMAVAGEWAGFDIDWLAARILRQQARPRWLRPRGRLLRGTAAAIWSELEPRIRGYRDGTLAWVAFPHRSGT